MLKIATLNLNYFVEKHGSWASRRKTIIETLSVAEPDIIAFQAVAQDPHFEDGSDQATQICRELKSFQYHIFIPSLEENGRKEGSAIISKIPFVDTDSVKLRLKDGEDKSPRVLLRVRIKFSGRNLHLFNAHFSWVPELAIDNVKEVLPIVNASAEPAILVGDLNNPPESEVFDHFKNSGWIDGWEITNPSDEGFTFESGRLFTRIDYAWVNGRLKDQVKEVRILKPGNDLRLSDHLGLLIKLKE